MADTERLYQFPQKVTPVGADIVYLGDSADGFNEVYSTIEALIGAYPGLLSIAQLTTVANQMIYTTAPDTYATLDTTLLGRSILDVADEAAFYTLLGLGTAATKNVSDDTEDFVPSLHGSFTPGNVPQFSDIDGTIEDSGFTPTGFSVVGQARGSTTADLAGYTYSNGTAGVGATLTAGSNGAFTSDGITWVANDKVLVQFQTAPTQNGLFDLTTLGDGSNPAVLTRTPGYDTAADISKGDIILVAEGTLYSQTSWMEVDDVNLVGTDPIEFQQFTANPSTFLVRANNLSDLTSASTARTNLGVLGADEVITTINVQRFTASGTYTPTAGMVYCIIECLGAGGGGGGTSGNASGAGCGGGGGSGGYARALATLAQINGTAAITIGAGGAGGTAGANAGSTGGTTSVVANGGAGTTLMSCTGGGGGSGNTASGSNAQSASGGAHGVPTTNTVSLINSAYGAYGAVGQGIVVSANTSHFNGYGAPSYYGGGGSAGDGNSSYTGNGSANIGAGGGGGAYYGSASSFAGGAGAQGIVSIVEFITG